jgi:hypothetical protein
MSILYVFPAFADQPKETIYKITAATEAEGLAIAGANFDPEDYSWGFTPIADSDQAEEFGPNL